MRRSISEKRLKAAKAELSRVLPATFRPKADIDKPIITRSIPNQVRAIPAVTKAVHQVEKAQTSFEKAKTVAAKAWKAASKVSKRVGPYPNREPQTLDLDIRNGSGFFNL